MRLIDADALIKRFSNSKCGKTFKTMVNTQLTAYDVDKVIEHDKQIRAEVIKEFLNKAKELYPNDSNTLYKLMCIAGQLKEKKQ